ncbi:DUF6777 domain-containing protein [Nakamurella sp.]|uniref:DUF6777 domain-containing protein n=1 Tax=Nakamurella sp. TaxID=1869182 RepID=UPI0037845DBB
MSDLPPPPPPATKTRRPVGLWVALAVAVALLVGVGATAVIVLTGDQPAAASETVLLEPAADPGPDPFVSTVAISAVPTFPDEVRAVAASTANGLAVDPAAGTRTAAGTIDALYGGSGELGTCDPDQLVDFLAANPAPAAAWADVHDIAPDRIGDYVATLTPVVLLYDTAITNYGLQGGVATPRQSVLQAGTAVLVDPTGTPAVRCACGNPLTAPTVRTLPAADLQGIRWDGFDPAAAVAVTPGPRTATFTLVDIATAATFQRPAGLASLSTPALLAATPTGIQRSTDGQQWTVVGTIDPVAGTVDSLDASDDLVVAVGGVRWDGTNQPSGVIVTSTDGSTWSEPIAVADYLVDVAYGNGSWLALGGASPGATPDSIARAVLYRSSDGRTWDRQEVTLPGEHSVFDLAGSIDFGAGHWLIPAADNVGDSGIPYLFSSSDGATWTDVPVPNSEYVTDARAFTGQAWGITGAELFYDNGLNEAPRQELRVGGSGDGAGWQPVPGTPANLRLIRLSCTADRGWLGSAVDTTASGWVGAIHTSADLVTWSPLGTGPDGGVTDVIAVGAGTEPDPAKCGTPAATAPTVAAGECDLGRALGDGRRELGVVTGGELTCDEMRSRWTAYWDWTGPKQGTAAFLDFGDGWSCDIVPLSAQLPGQNDWGWDGRLGECGHADGRAFAAYPQDRLPAGGTPDGTPSTTPAAPPGPADGDLGLTRPISRPACDGTGIVILHSSVDPDAYASEMQTFLNRFPNAQYLRTDLTGCSSLNRMSQQGTLIYAAYIPVGNDQAAVCAALRESAGAYAKWLDNTSDPNSRIACG